MKTKAKWNKQGELIVDAAGRKDFDDVYKYADGSTETRRDKVRILTEADGSRFVDALGRKEFNFVFRNADGSTETRCGDVIIVTDKHGKLVKE